MKPLALAVCVTIIAALAISACGCTTTTNSNQAASATSHDAFLEHYLATLKNEIYSVNGTPVEAWQLDWINSTSARVQFSIKPIGNLTLSENGVYTVFPTTQDATNYVNAMDLTAYSLASTNYTGGAYKNATGHAPQIYKQYQYNEGSLLAGNASIHRIEQFDNIVAVYTDKEL
jgi:hypothetical protein